MPLVTDTNRSFGILFTIIVAAGAAYCAWKYNLALATPLFAIALVLLIFAIYFPSRLEKGKRTWLLLGEKLSMVVNPIVLAVLFFGVVTPTAFVSRALGRDVLRLRPRSCSTYWLERQPSDRSPRDFFYQQF